MQRFEEFFKDMEEKSSGIRSNKSWLSFLLTIVFLAVYFYLTLPSLSYQSPSFYSFLLLGLLVFTGLRLIFGPRMNINSFKRSLALIALLLIIPFVFNLISSPIFRAESYAKLLVPESGVFEEEVEKIALTQVPIVDRETASIIGAKQLGSLTELVSQFEIDPQYSQIDLAGKPFRVSPLRYFDIIKYITNRKGGIGYYVSVDMTTQGGEIVKLDKPIFFSSGDYLMRNIYRKIRFQYPFSLLGETNFEIDDKGDAYYVTPLLRKTIGFFGGLDAKGAIITDANTGVSTLYDLEDVPTWVDRVFPAEIIVRQLDDYGLYKGGFFNSIFGQKNVTSTTEGYNYISIDQDIYLTTGVTSVRSDDSNLGFYYTNMRTKDSKFYPLASATEVAAMGSAQGKVQEKEYRPTFPVILNVADRPVYFMSLKDDAKTAKMYALVDAQQFTNVYVADTVDELFRSYNKFHLSAGVQQDMETVTIKEVREITLEGSSLFYFTVKENDNIYEITASVLGPEVLALKEGSRLKVLASLRDNIYFVESLDR